MKFFELSELPYGTDALEPHVSAETLEFHHGKHHAGYVDTLNELLTQEGAEPAELEHFVLTAEGAVSENAGQAWNHAFYWESMAPDGGGEPGRDVAAALEEAFGGTDAFREQFAREAVSHFGSGWAWLVATQAGRLEIVTTHDARCPLRDGSVPLLTCDVWEHAYYLDHRNDRGAYLDAFFEVVDWQRVAERLATTTLLYGARRA